MALNMNMDWLIRGEVLQNINIDIACRFVNMEGLDPASCESGIARFHSS